ncbi:MAG: hypothetical protein CSA35_02320 [Dethiosulfovibrio peptidovorans]|nr:MAG: hypothetical protein CSA35_02320 [Dethiosulfovibrio peptidovorans]
MFLRRVTRRDLPRLRVLYKELGFDPILADVFFSRDAQGNFCVKMKNGRIVGHICCSYFRPFYLNIFLGKIGRKWGPVPHWLVRGFRFLRLLSSYEVSNIIILPQWRGRGYGKSLIQAGVYEACSRKEPFIQLLVHKDNLPALELYKKCGFYVHSLWEMSKYVMRKDLFS